MSRFDEPTNTRPVMWLGGQALYTPHVIALGYVVTMLLTTACMALKLSAPFVWLPFSSAEVLRGEVWRLLTYGLVNPPSLWFVVDMFMLVWFGRELEKFFGRRVFLQFYAGLYLLTPLLFTVVGIWYPLGLTGQTGSFALFIAFATLLPGAMFLFNLEARWLALILVAIYTLIHLANRDLPGLLSLWATVGFAHGFVRFQQGRWTLPRITGWFKRPKLRVLPDLPPDERPTPARPANPTMAEMDALLDKIARSGLGSLTAKERAKLEQSRAELLKQRGTGGPRRTP